MTAGASMLAMTRKCPPHCRQVSSGTSLCPTASRRPSAVQFGNPADLSMSMANTCLRHCAHDIARCRSLTPTSPRSVEAAARAQPFGRQAGQLGAFDGDPGRHGNVAVQEVKARARLADVHAIGIDAAAHDNPRCGSVPAGRERAGTGRVVHWLRSGIALNDETATVEILAFQLARASGFLQAWQHRITDTGIHADSSQRTKTCISTLKKRASAAGRCQKKKKKGMSCEFATFNSS